MFRSFFGVQNFTDCLQIFQALNLALEAVRMETNEGGDIKALSGWISWLFQGIWRVS